MRHGIWLFGAVVAGLVTTAGCAQPVAQSGVRSSVQSVTVAGCPHAQAVVRRALKSSHIRVDVTGDGRRDVVAAASDPSAAKPCRGFVAVRVKGGGVQARHLVPAAVPIKGIHARVVGLPHLGSRPGADIVVDTGGAVDAELAQLFTVSAGRLRAVRVPDQPDGSFLVEGGGVVYPRGAGCTASGRLVLSQAVQSRDGKRFEVTRRTYRLRSGGVGFTAPQRTTAAVPAADLGARFPEFVGPHWNACSGA